MHIRLMRISRNIHGGCDSNPYLTSPLFCPYGWHQVLPGVSRSQRAGSEVLVGSGV